jgi:hypothetical protein
MKDNLEAKFYDSILKASKIEIATLERIEFKLDKDIDNPSNTNTIDCTALFKETSRKTTKTREKNSI